MCIYALSGRSPDLRDRLEACRVGELVTSSIVYAEVMRGIAPDNRADNDRAAQFFRAVPVQPFDEQAALRFRDVPFRRAQFDRLIAAHSLALGLVLVTNNVSDFADIRHLKVEDWTR